MSTIDMKLDAYLDRLRDWSHTHSDAPVNADFALIVREVFTWMRESLTREVKRLNLLEARVRAEHMCEGAKTSGGGFRFHVSRKSRSSTLLPLEMLEACGVTSAPGQDYGHFVVELPDLRALLALVVAIGYPVMVDVDDSGAISIEVLDEMIPW